MSTLVITLSLMDRGFFLADARPSLMRAGESTRDPFKLDIRHPDHPDHGAAAGAWNTSDPGVHVSLLRCTTGFTVKIA